MKKTLVILLAAALLLSFLNGCKKRTEVGADGLPKKVTVGTYIYPVPDVIAIAQGWLAEEMGVEVISFDAGRDFNVAMATGSIDIGYNAIVSLAVAIANNIPIQVFHIQDMVGSAEGLIVRSNLGIKDARGLVGRRIGVTFASAPHYALIKYLEIYNVNPADVDVISMRTDGLAAAFIRGDIDGAYTWEPNVSRMINNGGVMLVNSGELADRGYPIMDLSVVRTEFAQKYPALVSAYVRAMDRAVALSRSDPQAAARIMSGYLGLTVEECLKSLKGNTWLSASEQRELRWTGSSAPVVNVLFDTSKFLYKQGDISKEPTSELFQRAVTGRYLDLATWEN